MRGLTEGTASLAWKKKSGMPQGVRLEGNAWSTRRAFARRQMSLEVGREKFERAFDWRAGHGDQVAKSFTFIKRENFAELFEDRLAALAGLNFFHHHRKRIGFHAAGRTLAAGFRGEKVGDAQHFFDDTSSFA